MKTSILKCRTLLLSGLFVLLVWSCETQELITYEGGTSFIHLAAGSAMLHINIASINPNDLYRDFVLIAPVTGDIVDYDRPITARLTPTMARFRNVIETPDTVTVFYNWQQVPDRDFEILPSYVEAGDHYGILRVRVHNRGLIKETLNETAIIIEPNEHFRVDFAFLTEDGGEIDRRIAWLRAENTLGMPNLWADQHGIFYRVFGAFSLRKYELIMDVIGFDAEFLIYNPYHTYDNPDGETSTDALARIGGRQTLIAWARAVQVRLNEYREEHGREMLDENGFPIRMYRDWTA